MGDKAWQPAQRSPHLPRQPTSQPPPISNWEMTLTFPAQDSTPETWGQCGSWGETISGQIKAGLPAEPTLLTTASGHHDQDGEGLRAAPGECQF